MGTQDFLIVDDEASGRAFAEHLIKLVALDFGVREIRRRVLLLMACELRRKGLYGNHLARRK